MKVLLTSPLLLLSALCGCALIGCLRPSGGPPQVVDVNGRVIDAAGQPIPGAKVLVLGHSVVTTGADGRFAVARVEVPYGLALGMASDVGPHVFLGVTRPDPVLFGAAPNERYQMSTAAATLLGAGADASGPDAKAAVAFVGGTATNRYTRCCRPAVSTVVHWFGTGGIDGTLHAFTAVRAKDESTVDHYVGYGRLDVRLMPQDATYAIELEPVNTAIAQIQEPAPPCDADSLYATCYVDFGQGRLGRADGPEGSAAWVPGQPVRCALPAVPTVTATFVLTADCGAGGRASATVVGVRPGVEARAVELVAPPTLMEPQGGAVVSASTRFAWTPTSPVSVLMVDTLYLGSSNYGQGESVYVFTSGDSVVLPDLSPIGFAMSERHLELWSVTGLKCPAEKSATGVDQLLTGEWSRPWCPVASESQPRSIAWR